MGFAELFPPGRVLWAVREGDLEGMVGVGASSNGRGNEGRGEGGSGSGSGRRGGGTGEGREGKGAGGGKERLRLFEVLDVEKVFSQIVFARDMLRCADTSSLARCLLTLISPYSSHLPHQYDRVLEELL